MTALTPETLVRHELAGLSVRVVEATNTDAVGIEGRVVDETTRTLLVEDDTGTRQVPKAGATFEFALDGTRVAVEGERLVGRPARRTERRSDSRWR